MYRPRWTGRLDNQALLRLDVWALKSRCGVVRRKRSEALLPVIETLQRREVQELQDSFVEQQNRHAPYPSPTLRRAIVPLHHEYGLFPIPTKEPGKTTNRLNTGTKPFTNLERQEKRPEALLRKPSPKSPDRNRPFLPRQQGEKFSLASQGKAHGPQRPNKE